MTDEQNVISGSRPVRPRELPPLLREAADKLVTRGNEEDRFIFALLRAAADAIESNRESSPELATLAAKYLKMPLSDMSALANSGEIFEDIKSMAGSILAQTE